MEDNPSFGGSIRRLELSRACNTRDGLGIFTVLEDTPTCKPGTPTLDGGKCSSGLKPKELSRTSRTRRDWMLLEEETKKATTFRFTERTELLLRSGSLSTKTKLRSSRPKV